MRACTAHPIDRFVFYHSVSPCYCSFVTALYNRGCIKNDLSTCSFWYLNNVAPFKGHQYFISIAWLDMLLSVSILFSCVCLRWIRYLIDVSSYLFKKKKSRLLIRKKCSTGKKSWKPWGKLCHIIYLWTWSEMHLYCVCFKLCCQNQWTQVNSLNMYLDSLCRLKSSLHFCSSVGECSHCNLLP